MDRSAFRERFEEFMAYLDVEKGFSHNTIKSYFLDLQQLERFWERFEQRESKQYIFKSILDRFFLNLHHKKTSKSSIARKISCFNSFEKFLLTQNIELKLNLTRPKIDKKLPVFLSPDEVFFLLDKISNEQLPTEHPERDRTILEFLYATGIRCSELTNITMADIDFAEKTIRIKGKGNKERIVLFGEKAKQQALKYLSAERIKPQNNQEPLFLNNRIEQMSSRAIQRVIKMFRKFLKIERNITPHKIRHTFATHMLNQGVDLRVVQELLGHKSLSSTEKYTHVSTPRLVHIYETVHPIKEMIKKTNKKHDSL
jgi:site-specific recombinase XerD